MLPVTWIFGTAHSQGSDLLRVWHFPIRVEMKKLQNRLAFLLLGCSQELGPDLCRELKNKGF